MKRYRTSRSRSIELALAAPAVIAMRTARMMVAGANPTPADRREMSLMVSEKKHAFTQAWIAMAANQQRAQAQWWMALAQAWWAPWFAGRPAIALEAPAVQALWRKLQRSQEGVLASGILPIHRTATANFRRLSRARTR